MPEVTNNGNVPLNFTTSESDPFSLAPGATNSFTVSKQVPPNTPGNCQTQVENTLSVTAIDQSDTLLKGNFCPTPASCTLSQNLQRGTLNTLVAQTLALQYNILFILCFAGQTLDQLVLAVANQLIGNSAAGGSTTQQQAGPMNRLLGCLNREG